MQFKQCACCGLSLPITIMRPIQVKHQGRLIVVGICDNCRIKKEAEAKRRQNETS